MKIIVAAATNFELSFLQKNIKNKNVLYTTTGVGMLATAVHLTQIIYENKPDIIIQIGIAGCFDTNIALGNVVLVENEYLGDVGVIEKNIWKDIFDMKLQSKSQKPFIKKAIVNKNINQYNCNHLPIVNAVTINQVSTQPHLINQLIKKYNPVIESMEGAALHYVGNVFNINYVQMRGISNYVGERDKNNWQIELALKNVAKDLKFLLQSLS